MLQQSVFQPKKADKDKPRQIDMMMEKLKRCVVWGVRMCAEVVGRGALMCRAEMEKKLRRCVAGLGGGCVWEMGHCWAIQLHREML